MAIITFWNNNTGKTGQTYSAIAVATQMALDHNYKILFLSTKYNDRLAIDAFGANEQAETVKKMVTNKNSMDLESGIEGVAKMANAGRLTAEMIPNYTKVILKDRLEILSGPKGAAKQEYEKLYEICKEIINVSKRYYDLVFIDLNNGMKDQTTKDILQMSDIIIFNVEQKLVEIENITKIKENSEILLPKKTMFLINKYDRESKYTAKNITREVGEKKTILTVPYTALYSEAIQEGLTAEFFIELRSKNFDDTLDNTVFFTNELKRTNEAIIYKMQELQMRI